MSLLSRELAAWHQSLSWRVWLYEILIFLGCFSALVAQTQPGSIMYAYAAGAFFGLVAACICSELRMNVLLEYADKSENFYLNGHKLYDVFDQQLFPRLYYYLGHGLCYEAAALNMLLFRHNRHSQIVLAEVKCRRGRKEWHAWTEIRKFGLWWTIDTTWDDRIVSLRLVHRIRNRYDEHRVFSWDEFWSYEVAHQLHDGISHRETSYLFYELAYFRKVGDGPKAELLVERFGYDKKLPNDGTTVNYAMIGFTEPRRPITQRVLNEYMANPRRFHPHRRTYRIACLAYRRAQELLGDNS